MLQCSVTLKAKNIFPTSKQNFPCWNFLWLQHFPWFFLRIGIVGIQAGGLTFSSPRRTNCAHRNSVSSKAFLYKSTYMWYTQIKPIFLNKRQLCLLYYNRFFSLPQWSNETSQPLNRKMARSLLGFHNIRYLLYLSFLDNPKVTCKATDSLTFYTTIYDLVSPEIHEETGLPCLAQKWGPAAVMLITWRYSYRILWSGVWSPSHQASCYFLKHLLD